MGQIDYSLCGVHLRQIANQILKSDDYGCLFLDNCGEPDLLLECTSSEDIPIPDSDCIREEREEMVFRRGSEIWRGCRTSPGYPPFSMLHYDLNDPQKAQLLVYQKAWDWAANPPWLWHNMAIPQILPHFGAMVLHGSYIEVNGKAIIFTAPSGTGKSTQAALWEKHRGAVVCNGDKTGLRVKDGVLCAWGLPFCGTSDICRNVTLPVAAIVSLSQATENRVTRLALPTAIQSVMQNVYTDRCVSEEWQQVMNLVLDVVSHVPVLHLACTPDERAVEVLENALRSL